MGFHKIGVVGAGQMGAGIAQVAATAGYDVCLMDQSANQLSLAMNGICKSTEKLELKGRLKNAKEIQSRVKMTGEIKEVAACDLVIEAIVENEEAKVGLFQRLSEFAKESTVFASNTSSISITRLGRQSGRPRQFIGLHFMNPVPLMKLVEVIVSDATDPAVVSQSHDLVKKMDKIVVQSLDYPGFVVNRILMPMINEAFQTWQEGVASPEGIDQAMKLGTNQPMGPLELADFIGLDTCLSILRVLHHGFGDPRYRPSARLVQLVDAGWHGKKSGRGVYTYS
ncbi:MAG: 3-hydroxyacyl-CoA dehydrogenase family protein [Oligoflexales bacterium]